MSIVKIGLFLVFFDFVAFTAWVVHAGGGPGEVIAQFAASPWALQVAADLVIALSLVCVWIWRDARARGANPVPWIVATALTGSIAPLAYLLLRPGDAPAPNGSAALVRS